MSEPPKGYGGKEEPDEEELEEIKKEIEDL